MAEGATTAKASRAPSGRTRAPTAGGVPGATGNIASRPAAPPMLIAIDPVPLARAEEARHRPIEQEEPLAASAGAFQASAQALTSWAMNAGVGRVCIYARTERLGRGGAGERARQLHAMGLVRMLPQRKSDGGLFDYRVERTNLAFALASTPPDPAGLRPDARLLLDLLTTLAEAGDRCPCDRDLAALLGFKRRETVQAHLYELRRRGLVRWRLVGFDEKLRVVTVLESGASTSSPKGAA